jgi:hypothetical protein
MKVRVKTAVRQGQELQEAQPKPHHEGTKDTKDTKANSRSVYKLLVKGTPFEFEQRQRALQVCS